MHLHYTLADIDRPTKIIIVNYTSLGRSRIITTPVTFLKHLSPVGVILGWEFYDSPCNVHE